MVVGKIVAAHGLKGHVRVEPTTDFFSRFAKGSRLLLKGEWVTVESFAVHKNRPLLKLSGIDSMTDAESYKWAELSIPDGIEPEIDDDEYLVTDLIGLRAFRPGGEELGVVTDVVASPAHDILVLGEVMIPFVERFVIEVDITGGRIVLDPVPGTMPGEDTIEVR